MKLHEVGGGEGAVASRCFRSDVSLNLVLFKLSAPVVTKIVSLYHNVKFPGEAGVRGAS